MIGKVTAHIEELKMYEQWKAVSRRQPEAIMQLIFCGGDLTPEEWDSVSPSENQFPTHILVLHKLSLSSSANLLTCIKIGGFHRTCL